MKPDRAEIVATIMGRVNEVTRDWDVSADVTPHTKLMGELGFTSMDVIDLLAMLDIAFQVKLPYEQLVIVGENEYRQELTVDELAAFVDAQFESPRDERPEAL